LDGQSTLATSKNYII